MLSYTELKKGTLFVKDGVPFEVLDSSFSRMQQRKAVVQAKIRNLVTGKQQDLTFQPSDQFEEANVTKKPMIFLYEHRGDFVFVHPDNRQKRFTLTEDQVGDSKKWLIPNTQIVALFFDEQLLNFVVPIKMDFKVTEAAPGVQGDRATSGNKTATIETGAVIQVPLFINTGDIIRINTETGTYTERVEKAS
ncbi:MAG: elongation factor P [Candidatus Sungbacteria bacterium]|nr:elongation factor P [bacterium]MDZ4260520.1 elongation factor P [Candidatus Sungbacteria bacterium]